MIIIVYCILTVNVDKKCSLKTTIFENYSTILLCTLETITRIDLVIAFK